MERILNISYKHNLSHIGSCLTTYPILRSIYNMKKKDDIVILSAGHAGLAQYVCIEEDYGVDAEDMLHMHGIHPARYLNHHIHVSSGSLGSAILIGVGMAHANRNRNVYVVCSDGECAEGNVWEALCFVTRANLTNLQVHVNINGYSAYDEVDRGYLEQRLKVFCPWVEVHHTTNPNVPYLSSLNGHYHVLQSEREKKQVLSIV